MSTPRKIWADECMHGWDHPLASRFPMRRELYHHDDVVRELIAALEECRDELDAYYKAEYPLDHPLHERERNFSLSQNPARAALAKIAQEG